MTYTVAVATAARLIGAKGRPITLLPPEAGPADPDKPWAGADDQAVLVPNAIGVFLDFRKEGSQFAGLRPGGLNADPVEVREKRLLIAASGAPFTPNTGMRVVDTDGRRYKITEIIKQLEPGDAVILWEVGVRA